MAAQHQLNFPVALGTLGIPPAMNTPPSPNKLDMHKDLELKQFKVTDFQSLTRLVKIQCWYNRIYSNDRICGINHKVINMSPIGTFGDLVTSDL
jgi:hypothetical protein